MKYCIQHGKASRNKHFGTVVAPTYCGTARPIGQTVSVRGNTHSSKLCERCMDAAEKECRKGA